MGVVWVVITKEDLDDDKENEAGKVNYDVKPFASLGNIKVINEMHEMNECRYKVQ